MNPARNVTKSRQQARALRGVGATIEDPRLLLKERIGAILLQDFSLSGFRWGFFIHDPAVVLRIRLVAIVCARTCSDPAREFPLTFARTQDTPFV
jgi:hypothetical protein